MDLIRVAKKIKKFMHVPLKYHWPRVIMFHSAYPIIDRGDIFHNWNSTTQKIKDIVSYLQKHGTIIDEEEFLSTFMQGKMNYEGKYLITFDDGYKAIFDQLSDFFYQRKIRPLLFLSVGQFVSSNIPWFEKIALLFRYSENKSFIFNGLSYNILDVSQRNSLYGKIQNHFIETCTTIEEVERVITELFQQSKNMSPDNLIADKDMQILSKKEVEQLLAMGWNLGSHGYSHFPLTLLNESGLEFDLSESKRVIEESFSLKVKSISYPNGCVNKKVIQKVKSMYDAGFCAIPSMSLSRYLIPRFGFPEDENRIRKLILKENEVSSVLTTGKIGYSPSVPLMLLNKHERSLLLKKFTNIGAEQNCIEMEGQPWGNSLKSDDCSVRKPSIVLLCGSGCPERYALVQLAKKYTIAAVFIDSMGQYRSHKIFRLSTKNVCLPPELPTHALIPYVKYETNEQENILGSDSLAWFIPMHTKIYSVKSINDPGVTDLIHSFNPSMIIVFGTSLLREKRLLDSRIPKYNLHWGLSPWFRGSYTVRWPVLENRLDGIGVTIHEIDSGVDSGSIISQGKPVLDGTENSQAIEYKVTVKGVELLIEIIEKINEGKIPSGIKQDLSKGQFYSVKKWNSTVNSLIEDKLTDGFVYKNHSDDRNNSFDIVNATWQD
jgi:methionyl-tRNA formyltransferase/peptidoglycan/xylan/chitin deacetylase (PgdA/CDA1 family)